MASAFHFWFDFASTYSYVTAMRISPLAETSGLTVRWRPFLLGPIFKAQGWDNSPFNLYPVKGRYMWRDLARICDTLDLPFVQPSPFPQNSVTTARVALVGHGKAGARIFAEQSFGPNSEKAATLASPPRSPPRSRRSVWIVRPSLNRLEPSQSKVHCARRPRKRNGSAYSAPPAS